MNHDVAAQFLVDLFDATDTGWINAWGIDRNTDTKLSAWAPVDKPHDLIAQIAEWPPTTCIWFGAATRHKRHPGTVRGGANDCRELVGLWVDVDIAGDAHADGNLPPNADVALEIVERFPLAPTALINSGHGLQAWWKFTEPLADRAVARPLLDRWAATWAHHAKPYSIDNVFDPARIMRLPGTINNKVAPCAVTVLDEDWTRTYSVEDIDQLLLDAPAPVERTESPWTGDEGLPGQVFNQRHTGHDMLERLGFHSPKRSGDAVHYMRPGKARGGTAASVYDDGHTTIYSDTVRAMWPEIELRRPYDPFGLYTVTQFDGDFTAASDELQRLGYGTKFDDSIEDFILDIPDVPNIDLGEPADPPSGWEDVDLTPILEGNYVPPTPTMTLRSDGLGLVYAGKVHSIAGEPGGGKTWLALYMIVEEIRRGGKGALIDYEDTPDTCVHRLLTLGLDRRQIAEQFHYIRPDGPLATKSGRLNARAMELLQRLDVDIVVIDSVGESLSVEGLPPNDDDAVTQWFRRLPRMLARRGAAVVTVDHVTKNKDDRGLWAIGSQRKLAAIDGAAYGVEVKVAPTKSKDGKLTLTCAKDRNGCYQKGALVANVAIENAAEGVQVVITAPESKFRPTHYMEQVSRFLEEIPCASQRGILDGVTGRASHLKVAIECLVEEGFVTCETTKRGNQYQLVTAFRDDSEVEAMTASTASHRVPENSDAVQTNPESDRVHRVPDPLRSRGLAGTQSEASGDTETHPTDRDRVPAVAVDIGAESKSDFDWSDF